MVKPSLLSGGRHYDLLINWDKRIRNEVPFLEYFLSQNDFPIKDILEIGCGTGYHAKALLDLGYHVTGIDIDVSMVKEAKSRALNGNFIVMDFLDPLPSLERKFDSIISLGNSIGLIASTSDFESVINRFPLYLKSSKSIIIFQLLNTEKHRDGWSNPRTIETKEGDYVFLRGFSTTKLFIIPEILTLFRSKKSNQWILHTTGKTKIPRITQKEIVALLEHNNFFNIKVFGNYNKVPFNSAESVDMIIVAHY